MVPMTLLVWMLAASQPVIVQQTREQKLADKLDEVHDRLDEVSWNTLYAIAGGGDEAAYEALLTAIGWLRKPQALQGAFQAFFYFRDDPTLSRRAIDYLGQRALGGGNKEVRRLAVWPLTYFGAAGHPMLERIVRESDDEGMRVAAIQHVLAPMLAKGDPATLRLVLDHAEASAISRQTRPFRAFDQDEARPLFLAKLADPKTSVGWGLILIDELRADPGEDLVLILRNLLRHRSSVLQVAAIRALVARGEEAQARTQLERMRLSSEPHVKVEVVRILTQLSTGDPAWRDKLTALARGSNPNDRIASVAGLSVLADPPALALLEELLSDRIWRVRDAALVAARELRRKELLLPIIERLDQESGALQWKVVSVLERLTGLQLGRSQAAWKRWYEEKGAAEELPALEAVLELEAKRAAPRAEDASVAQFYGLPVRSKNVYFLVDASGSMGERATGAEPETTSKKTTRFDVAKQELGSLLQRMGEDSRCNLVFFSGEVDLWQDELQRLDAKGLAGATKFVEEAELGGGTDIHGALVAAFEDLEADTFYLLTDGEPTVGEVVDPLQLREDVAQWNSVARVTLHCVSVGQGSQLLRNLAQDSGGTYLEVGLDQKVTDPPGR